MNEKVLSGQNTCEIPATVEDLLQSPERLAKLPKPYADIKTVDDTTYVKELPGEPGILTSKTDRSKYRYVPISEEHQEILDEQREILGLDKVMDLYDVVLVDGEEISLLQLVEQAREEYMYMRYKETLLREARLTLTEVIPDFAPQEPTEIITKGPYVPNKGGTYICKYGSRHFIAIDTDQRRLTIEDLDLNTAKAQENFRSTIHELIHQSHAEKTKFTPVDVAKENTEVNFDNMDPIEAVKEGIRLEYEWLKNNPDYDTDIHHISAAVQEAVADFGCEIIFGDDATTINGGTPEDYSRETVYIVNGLRKSTSRENLFELISDLADIDLEELRTWEEDNPGLVQEIISDPSRLFHS